MASLREKKVIIFDLDGTLAETKSPIDREMAALILTLLKKKKVAIIGGGTFPTFKYQILDRLPRRDARLKNLFLFPTTAEACYQYRSGWKKIYARKMSAPRRARIKKVFREVLDFIGYAPQKKYGPLIEDRGTQVTFSALGQDVVKVLGEKAGVRLKKNWIRENAGLKSKIASLVQKKLPGYEVMSAGYTSIDVTEKGIDKAYGVRRVAEYVRAKISEMVFVGDALGKGGNDAPAKKTGVESIAVRNPEATKKLIYKLD